MKTSLTSKISVKAMVNDDLTIIVLKPMRGSRKAPQKR